jgi:flagellar biosynthesis protein FliR
MSSGVADLAGSLGPLLQLASAHLAPVSLAVARLAPIVWLAPIFGGRLLPAPARITLVLGLALVLAPPAEGGQLQVGLALLGALAVEALIGLSLGLLSSLPFELARAGGHLVDVARGASFAEVMAPGLADRATPIGDVLYLALLVALTAAGGDRLFILALADGFAALPPGAPIALAGGAAMAGSLLDATSALLSTALVLAAPPVIVALLADVVLGVVGRVVPQLPLFFLGMPLKTVLGLLLVAFALGPMLAALLQGAADTPEIVVAMTDWLAGDRQ